MSSQSKSDPAGSEPSSVGYLAIGLAWAVPGLGHVAIGQRARGIVFGITIHGLFAMGMLLAGLRAINPPDQAIWSYTQWLTGWPMAAASHFEKALFKQPDAERILEGNYEAGDWRKMQDAPPEEQERNIQERERHARDFIAAHPLFAYHPKVQDIGAVYCGIAGMLNLLVIFDVLLRVTGSKRPETPSTSGSFVGQMILQGSGASKPEKTKSKADEGGVT